MTKLSSQTHKIIYRGLHALHQAVQTFGMEKTKSLLLDEQNQQEAKL
jgi:hypothetical protein